MLSLKFICMKLNISSEINFQSFSNCLSVKIFLTTGQCQVLKNHLPLVGSVDNDLLELERVNDLNEKIKISYLLQDAIVVVSNDTSESSAIYVYARKMLELSSNLSMEELMKDLTNKQKSLEFELDQVKSNSEREGSLTNSKIIILDKEIKFLQKAYVLLKEKLNV